MDVFKEIQSLGFPEDKFVVLGGASMAAYGLREAKDIDIFVAPDIFEQCKNSGQWEVHMWDQPNRGGDEWLKKGDFELYGQFWYGDKYYTFEELLPYTDVVQGLRVQPIYWLMNWKKAHGRPKDLSDASLIENYLLKQRI